ncbi:MAG: hypothetical protein ACLVGL_04475 [Waltera sp.]
MFAKLGGGACRGLQSFMWQFEPWLYINYWFIIVPVIIAIVMGIKYFAKTDLGKHVFGKIAN